MRFISLAVAIGIYSIGATAAPEKESSNALTEVDALLKSQFKKQAQSPFNMANSQAMTTEGKAINDLSQEEINSNPKALRYLEAQQALIREQQHKDGMQSGTPQYPQTDKQAPTVNAAIEHSVQTAREQVGELASSDEASKLRDSVQSKVLPTNSQIKHSDPSAIAKASQKKMEQYKQSMAREGVTELFSDEQIEEKTRQYRNAAQILSSQSHQGMANALEAYGGVDKQSAQYFSGNIAPGQADGDSVKNVMFISFSMGEKALLEAMQAAVRDGSMMVLNGIADHHEGIHDTIRELQFIGRSLDVKPDVRFMPKLFEKYSITKVPTILYGKDDINVSAEGIINVGWLKSKYKTIEESKFLGNYGLVHEVEEESLLETIKKRMANYDWTGKREQAIDGYWKKQKFNTLPAATEDETWFIDPTVKVQKDIKNPRGEFLARQGQVVNPLSSAAVPLTIYAFAPSNMAQLQWVHKKVISEQNTGQVMLMFSKLKKENGWDHLSSLRQHFGRELYQLPDELIKKFDLTGLPAKVTSDLSKKVFKVEQFKMEKL